jgi:hypothetical protein
MISPLSRLIRRIDILKKIYIKGLGDTVDLIIINGRRNAKNITEFYIGKLF